MAVELRNNEEIERLYRAGQLVREVLDALGEIVVPGITTGQLDSEAERICLEQGGQCLFKGVPGSRRSGPFPGSICASINEEVVHGIPGDRVICSGDIVSVDFGARLDGWCGDAARTFCAGQVDPEKKRLVEITRYSLDIAVELIRPGTGWSDVARAISDYIRGEGFSVVEDFVGHGIGRNMHESPKIPNYVTRELLQNDIPLKAGMVLAVEPMVNMGSKNVKTQKDGWTVVTADGKPSAHWEHTLAITDTGARLLTS